MASEDQSATAQKVQAMSQDDSSSSYEQQQHSQAPNGDVPRLPHSSGQEPSSVAAASDLRKPRSRSRRRSSRSSSRDGDSSLSAISLYEDFLRLDEKATTKAVSKKLFSSIKHSLDLEERIARLERAVSPGDMLAPPPPPPPPPKESENKSPERRSADAYQIHYDWGFGDNDAPSNPDPALSWDGLLKFYTTNLKADADERTWGQFADENDPSESVISMPKGDWQTFVRQRPDVSPRRQHYDIGRILYDGLSRSGARGRAADLKYGRQAIRINSQAALNELRRITQKSLLKGILTFPYKDFWVLDAEIDKTMNDLRAQASDTGADISLLPFRSHRSDGAEHQWTRLEASEAEREHLSKDVMIKRAEESNEDYETIQKRNFSDSAEFSRLKVRAKAAAILEDYQCVVNFMRHQLQDAKARTIELKSQDVPEVEYRDLWKFYLPGTMVAIRKRGYDQALRVYHVTGGQPVCDPRSSRQGSKTYRRHRRVYDSDEESDAAPYVTDSEDEDPQFQSRDRMARNVTDLYLDCYYMNYDGKKYGPVLSQFTIRRYHGKQSLAAMEVVPLQFASVAVQPGQSGAGRSAQSLQGILRARGEKFRDFARKSLKKGTIPHKMYDGATLDRYPEEVESPVIVDLTRAPEATRRARPVLGIKQGSLTSPDPGERMFVWNTDHVCEWAGCTSADCREDAKVVLGEADEDLTLTWALGRAEGLSEHFNELTDADLTAEETLMLPYKVWGFVLRRRKWCLLDIDRIAEFEDKRPDPFKHLELPVGHKELVAQLVRHHLVEKRHAATPARSIARNMDPVQGKGNGLVVLLHGEPGVGKTSTAEASALKFNLPLYPITCGDLGDEAGVVEDQLQETFQDAHRWNCILLLDEADIFLARRTKSEMQRNALVSVFLRTLEYYDGILFLTTHRVGVLDDAFKSRIRLSLYYPPLDVNQTRKIFEKHIKMIQERSNDAEIDRDGIVDFAMDQFKKYDNKRVNEYGLFEGWWNGRQIRNAFQTAIALASFNERGEALKPMRLNVKHFRDVAKKAHEFDEYMKDTHGGISEARRAHEQEERARNVRRETQNAGWSPDGSMGRRQPQTGWNPDDMNRATPQMQGWQPQHSRTPYEGRSQEDLTAQPADSYYLSPNHSPMMPAPSRPRGSSYADGSQRATPRPMTPQRLPDLRSMSPQDQMKLLQDLQNQMAGQQGE